MLNNRRYVAFLLGFYAGIGASNLQAQVEYRIGPRGAMGAILQGVHSGLGGTAQILWINDSLFTAKGMRVNYYQFFPNFIYVLGKKEVSYSYFSYLYCKEWNTKFKVNSPYIGLEIGPALFFSPSKPYVSNPFQNALRLEMGLALGKRYVLADKIGLNLEFRANTFWMLRESPIGSISIGASFSYRSKKK